MPRLVDLEEEHIYALYPILRGDAKLYSLQEFYKFVRAASYSGWAVSAFDDEGKIFGMGGIIRLHKGVGHCWMAVSPKMLRYKFWTTKTLMKILIPMANRMGLHRIEAEVDNQYPNWLEWAKRFGFKEEGVMRQFGINKSDFTRISYVRELDGNGKFGRK